MRDAEWKANSWTTEAKYDNNGQMKGFPTAS